MNYSDYARVVPVETFLGARTSPSAGSKIADEGVRAPGRSCVLLSLRCALALVLPTAASAAIQAGIAERDITPQIGQERPGGYETRLTSYSNLDISAGRQFAETGVELLKTMQPGRLPEPPPLKKPGEPWRFGNVPPQLD